jgi:hypothetical protein
VLTATTCFNRALAFRPDDTDLISEVSSLARAQRFRRALMQGAVILTGSLIIAAALGGVFKLVAKARGTSHKAPVAAVAPAAGSATSRSKLPVVGQPDASARVTPPPKRRRAKPRPSSEAPKDVSEESASVTVVVNGPANATVLVDGQPFEPWFGVAHDLPAGEHVFEFRPPNTECCLAPAPKTVTIRPGVAQTVKGVIQWKPAILEFRGAPLSTASCGEVASFSQPGSVQIAMQAARQVAHCRVIPALQSGEAPKAFDVPLTPGRTSSFP